MSQPPRQRPPASRRSSGPPPPRRGGYSTAPRNVQTQRDPFPYIMGGIIGAMIIGLGAVIFLILSNGNSPTTVGNNNAGPTATADPNTPPRMSMADFKALYDDPAKRPLVVDVRPVASYAEGHIAGAVSMPEADIDIYVSKGQVPKDSLVVAYCQ